MSEPLESFGRFGDFPYELRQIVWHAALDNYLDSFPPRLFHVRGANKEMFTYWYTPGPPPMPPIAQVCRESHAAVKFYYISCQYQGYSGIYTLVFRSNRDVIHSFLMWHRNLDRIRNVGVDFFTMGKTTYMRQVLPQLVSRFPSLDTLYWLVPQRHWLYRRQIEPYCCCKLPSDLMDIPDEYDDLHPGFFDPENDDERERPNWGIIMRWLDVRARMTDVICEIREAGEIPREPKLQGMFIVRPECPGTSGIGTPCDLKDADDDFISKPYRREIPITKPPDTARPRWD
ncbi:hypothetical protein F4776DRAFT_622165 [Hypoxylon sp. NC0597]|nr:hypothetical protein F4776DRAFT_622165 [Hypoxylon sp. NC0597]